MEGNIYLIVGILLNTVCIILNRFWKKMPRWANRVLLVAQIAAVVLLCVALVLMGKQLGTK